MRSNQKIFAEFIGTLLLVATVVGSGAMAVNLSHDMGVQLLINTIATIFILALLIYLFADISGSHFNPVVTISELLQKRIGIQDALGYIAAQCAGGFMGAVLANLMFGNPAIFRSHHIRSGSNLFLSEVVATAGLLFVIQLLGFQKKGAAAPFAVAAWIGGAYFFTSSTSFANPAVTFARAWSDTFSGIALRSVPVFVVAQVVGASLGIGLSYLVKEKSHDR